MSSHRSNRDNVPCHEEKRRCKDDKGGGIGDIFRDYGEAYIREYKPYRDYIKFIRAVRICKTPFLGGTAQVCKKCKAVHYIYYSCGHSRCPLCQSIKREEWLDKLERTLLSVPYIHLVTTLPHALNRLCRMEPKKMYDLIFAATKQTVWKICKDPDHLGATPGMVSVLHTWGSDMRYHVHTHSLLTFGGMDANGDWQHPKHKKRICRNSKLRYTFREEFLALLKKSFEDGCITSKLSYEEIEAEVKNKSWSVHATHPTMSSQTIEKYLARYINRIAVSESRVKYVKEQRQVHLTYNDYRNQKEGEAAPKEIRKMDPLVFIHQLLSHLPPPHYQRTRRYGLHASSKSERAKKLIESKARNHPRAIRTVMEIITQLMKLDTLQCEECGCEEFHKVAIRPDKEWIKQYVEIPKSRAP